MTHYHGIVSRVPRTACQVVVAFSALGAALAEAGFNGHAIDLHEYAAPSPTGVPTLSSDFGTQVVGPGNELYSRTGWTIDIGDTEIMLTNNTGSDFAFGTAQPFFGDSFFDVFSSVDPVLGATLLSTNIVGMNAAHVTSDSDHVYLNFANLAIPGNGSFVKVGVAFVPEPTTAILATGGLALLYPIVRRRRRCTIR